MIYFPLSAVLSRLHRPSAPTAPATARSRRPGLTLGQGLAALILAVPLSVASGPALADPGPAPTLAQTDTTRPTLRLGDDGAAVTQVQAMLALLGYYPEAVDGQFSESTEAAVQAFQRAAGLIDDGIVGPATWRHLLPTPSTEFTPPPAPVTPDPPASSAAATSPDAAATPEADAPIDLPVLRMGTYGPAIARVQERLQDLGLYGGPLDGVFGPQTEAAVMTFQRSRQLTADGVVGPATWRALLRP